MTIRDVYCGRVVAQPTRTGAAVDAIGSAPCRLAWSPSAPIPKIPRPPIDADWGLGFGLLIWGSGWSKYL